MRRISIKTIRSILLRTIQISIQVSATIKITKLLTTVQLEEVSPTQSCYTTCFSLCHTKIFLGTDFSEFALMNSESQWQCSICGKQTSQKSNLLKHIENIHYPGTYSYTCHVCNKIFQNKNSFYKHQAVHK